MTKIKCPVCEHTNDAAQKECAHCGAPLPKVRVQPSGPKPASGAPPQAQAHGSNQSSFRKGQVVAKRYTILDIVGKGGMGCIYLVHDNTLKERVALKTLLPQYLRDKMVVERFFNEARIARQLSHPNIVRVHDIGIADEVLYISMEYLQGKSLRNMLEELLPGERMPVKDTLKIMVDLCTALEYAHQYTVHRDLKPENIMILPDGTLKLMDFGISKLMTSGKLTATAVVMGTPHYMPPEQFKDSSTVDTRADIYSIGVILYEILTGNLPTGVPKPASQILRDVPPALDPIIAKCVEPEPSKRYESATELKRALAEVAELLRGGTLDSRKGQGRTATGHGEMLRRVVGGLLAALVIVLTAVGVRGLEARRMRLVPEAAANVTADPAAHDARVWSDRYKEAAELIASADRSAASGGTNIESLAPIIDCAHRLRDAAAKSAEQDPQPAAKLAIQSLQCYAAAAKISDGTYSADLYRFVLPGRDAGQDGFFIAKHPISVGEFTAWASNNHWRTGAATPDTSPVVTPAYYDAEAFAASNRMRVPSQAEWQRACDGPHNDLITELPEWTRDVAKSSPDPGAPPAFGSVMVSVAVGADENGNAAPPAFGTAPYSPYPTSGMQLGFRCVVPMPENLAGLRELIGS